MQRAKWITILVAVGFVVACRPAQGQSLYFTNQAPAGASWFAAANWRYNATPYANALPSITTSAHISTGKGPGTAIVDGPGAIAKDVYLGWDGHPGNLQIQPGGELYVKGWCFVGYNSPAQLVIAGGVISGLEAFTIGQMPPPAAEPCKVEVVQYGGKVIATNGNGSLVMNADAAYQNYALGYPRYRLVNGLLDVGYLAVGGNGYAKFEIEGGTNIVKAYLRLGYLAGGDGVYVQSGGLVKPSTVHIGGSGAQGLYALSSGCLSGGTFFCGNGGEGRFVQSGGTNDTVTINIGGSKTGTGTGLYQISGGKLLPTHLNISTNGTFEITGNQSVISCGMYKQTAQSTLDLRLTNGVVSPIAKTWSFVSNIDGTLNVTLLGSQDSYPDPASVVTVMTYPAGNLTGTFKTIICAPANQLLGVRINYNETSITLDQWKYPPRKTLLFIR